MPKKAAMVVSALLLQMPALALQDCKKFRILKKTANQTIRARQIVKNDDQAVETNVNSAYMLDGERNRITLPLETNGIALNLTPRTKVRRAWECRFGRPVDPQRLVVRYRAVGTNGERGYFTAYDGAKVRVNVDTRRLRWNRRRTRVKGDMEITLDMSGKEATSAGPYEGSIEIEVYAK